MRPILALVILLVGFKSAMAEVRYGDSENDARQPIFQISINVASDLAGSDVATTGQLRQNGSIAPAGSGVDAPEASAKSEPTFATMAAPATDTEAAYHQREQTNALPSTPSITAEADAENDADIDSLDGLCSALLTSAQDNDL